MNQGYRIGVPLGRGRFGCVYRAEHVGDGHSVAIKVLDISDVEAVASRIRDEAGVVARVGHPAIANTEAVVPIGEQWGVVLELVEGASLSELAATSPLPPRVVASFGAVVAETLQSAWHTLDRDGLALELYHGDLKPSNIHITQDGAVKVLDFEVARAELAAHDKGLTIDRLWLAPERLAQIDDDDIPEPDDPQAGDVYALGAILVHAATGGGFAGGAPDSLAHTDGLVHARAGCLDTLGDSAEPLVELICSMLAYAPGARPTAGEVARRLAVLERELDGPDLQSWAAEAVGQVIDSRDEASCDSRSGTIVGVDSTIHVASAPIDDPSEDRPTDPGPVIEQVDHLEDEGSITEMAGAPAKAPPAHPSVVIIRRTPETMDFVPAPPDDWEDEKTVLVHAPVDIPEAPAAPVVKPTPAEPAPAQAAPAEPPQKSSRLGPVLLGLAMLALVFALGAWALLHLGSTSPTPGPAPAVHQPTPTPATEPMGESAATEPAATEPAVEPAATEPAVETAATEPAVETAATEPAVETAATEPVVEPVSKPPATQPTAAPAVETAEALTPARAVEPGAAPAAEPTATPAAEPTATPAAGPKDEPETKLAKPQPADSGFVRVRGDAQEVTLIQGSARLSPGSVPAGTYQIEAVFEGATPVAAGQVEVQAGQTVVLSCSAQFTLCRAN